MTQDTTTAPFVGLRTFDRDDHFKFKGRSREIAVLTRKIRASRFTAVVGASGSGKSSLVRAGVLPELARDGWVDIIAKPGSAPITMLANALGKAADDGENDPLAEARRYRFSANLRTSAYGLADLTRSIALEAPRLILVIDQFEELFRYGEEAQGSQKAAMREESRAFVELLLTAAAQAESRMHIIVTMRSDFFGNCSAYAGLAEAISESQYLVPLPGRDDLEKVIRDPVADAGSTIDDSLVQRLLIDMEEQVDRLPTLQHTLRRLWDEAQGDPKHLSEQDYTTIGGMAGSINRKAEQIRGDLEKVNPVDGITLERVMKAITTLDDQGRAIRRPQKRSKLKELLADGAPQPAEVDQSLDRVIQALAKEDTSFLALGDSEDPDVDIGHEALIRSWCRMSGDARDFRSGWLVEERSDGRQWRELVGRTERKQRLSYTDRRRIRAWIKKQRITRVWCARYGDAWEDVEHLQRKSLNRFLLVSLAVTVLSVMVLFGLITLSSRLIKKDIDVKRFASARANTAAGYAKMLARDGNTRLGALVALDVTRESDSNHDLPYNPKVEAALAQALNMPIEIFRLGIGIHLNQQHGQALNMPIARFRLMGQDEQVFRVAFSPDGRRIISGSADGTLRLWDAETGLPIGQPLEGGTGMVYGVAFSPDGKRIVSGSADGTLRLWNAETGLPAGQPLMGHTGKVSSVAFSPNGRRIVSASTDKTLRLWNAATGAPIGKPLLGHRGIVNSVAFSPDGRLIVSASSDNTLQLWNAAKGALAGQPLRGHESSVNSVVFSPDSKRIVSGSSDNSLRLWNAVTGVAIGPPLRGHDREILGVAISPDGKRIASASSDETLRIWDAAFVESVSRPLPELEKMVGNSFAISPGADGKQRLVSGSADGTLRLWDAETGALVGKPWNGHAGMVNTLSFSSDGRQIVTGGSDDRTLRLWDTATGAPIWKSMRDPDNTVVSVAFSRDGLRLVSGSAEGKLRLWDAKTGRAIASPLSGHEGIVWSVVFSRDGHLVASGSADKTIRLWDAETGQAIGQPLQGHQRDVTSIVFSDDGKHIVSGSSDGTLRIWDANKGTAIGKPLLGHAGSVRSVAFSVDGRRIVSGSRDSTLRVWDAATGAAIGQPLRGHENVVSKVAFLPDGRHILSVSEDNTVRIWDAGNLLAKLDELVSRAKLLCPLNKDERQELALSDPNIEAQDKQLTEAQRFACGENQKSMPAP